MLPDILNGIPPNLDPCRSPSSERDPIHFGVPDQGRTRWVPGSEDDVYHTLREITILDDLCQN